MKDNKYWTVPIHSRSQWLLLCLEPDLDPSVFGSVRSLFFMRPSAALISIAWYHRAAAGCLQLTIFVTPRLIRRLAALHSDGSCSNRTMTGTKYKCSALRSFCLTLSYQRHRHFGCWDTTSTKSHHFKQLLFQTWSRYSDLSMGSTCIQPIQVSIFLSSQGLLGAWAWVEPVSPVAF